ncbi:AT-rich interactive domain-containing protein 2 [Forsythia ovata]|uniref:AT-rich interactive domain-containing protein 2 n=1 Tax=Forsythia ovata TaxID=205694 RepID=A0ABD1PYN5_9LAMI
MTNKGLFNSDDGWVLVASASDDETVNEEENKRGSEDFGEERYGVDGGNIDGREMDTSGVGEDSASRKRKPECYSGMLDWITKVAKDPCDPTNGSLPERHNWKYYGCYQLWKQVLLVRDAMLLRRNADSTSQETISQAFFDSNDISTLQKKQKMHPSLYDDRKGSERLRCSKRLLSAKDSFSKSCDRIGVESSSSGSQCDEVCAGEQSNSTADSVGFAGNFRRKKQIPLGPLFQADVPDFCEEAYKIDCKWLGTRIWPLEKRERNKNLIERVPIGRGRRESCGCQFPGSVECVRFHVAEKRMMVKLELGTAFYGWKFNSMGEEVALSWTKEDENKFQDIVKSNCLLSEKYFWDELFKFFPRKDREALVNYYYNVFLLRRRGYQNRNDASDIDSDDEESEFGPVGNRFGQNAANSPGSIFCSPKKSHLNIR